MLSSTVIAASAHPNKMAAAVAAIANLAKVSPAIFCSTL